MNKIKIEEMDLNKISKDIVHKVINSENTEKDFVISSVEGIIQKQVIDVISPESVYEINKEYSNLGVYIGVFDTYPWNCDYFIRNHHFIDSSSYRKDIQKINEVARINKVFIRQIKRFDK